MTSFAVLATLKNLLGNRALLPLRELRAALPGMSRAAQDQAIAELEAAGLVYLHYHDAAAGQTEAERAPYIHRGNYWFHAIARRRAA